jgi:hypothetical protein
VTIIGMHVLVIGVVQANGAEFRSENRVVDRASFAVPANAFHWGGPSGSFGCPDKKYCTACAEARPVFRLIRTVNLYTNGPRPNDNDPPGT